MAASRTVVVLGGGVGGVAAARELRRRLPPAHRVIMVDRERHHVFAPSLLWLMVGRRSAASIQRPMARLARRGIEVVSGEVEGIDVRERSVTVSGVQLRADYLVIALGAALSPELVPGLAETGHNFYTLAGAESLRRALESEREGRVVVLTAAPAYKCPAAPYEAALLIDDFVRRRGLRGRLSLEVCAAEPGPMGVAGPVVSAAVVGMLAAREIAYLPGHQVTAVDAGARLLRFANLVQRPFDVLAAVPPHIAPRVVRESGLVSESGWIRVDRHTLETLAQGVYAIGDVVSIPLSMGKPLPKAGVFARAQGEVVAANITRAITGQGAAARFMGDGQCFLETGGGKAGFASGNFYAEPVPAVRLRAPGRLWHIGKVAVEQSWLRRTL